MHKYCFLSCEIVLGLPGLLCPEATMCFFSSPFLSFFPPSFGLPTVLSDLLCQGDLLDEGFSNSSHTCSFREWLLLCLLFLSQAGREGKKSPGERKSSLAVIQWERGHPWPQAGLLEQSTFIQWQFSSSVHTSDAERTILLWRTILGTVRQTCREHRKNKQAEYKYFVSPPDSFFVWSPDLTDLPLKWERNARLHLFS